VGASKFIEGAWIPILLVPTIVTLFLQIRRHYREVGQQLALPRSPTGASIVVSKSISSGVQPALSPRVVVPISGVHQGTVSAINFARAISKDVTAVYIELEPQTGPRIQSRWQERWPDVPLMVVPSPYRSIVQPLLDFLDETDRQHGDGQLAVVVLPEFVPAKWWHNLLHNQTVWLIKTALLYRRRHLGYQRVIVEIPYHLQR
jgi:hypothetical protein